MDVVNRVVSGNEVLIFVNDEIPATTIDRN